MRVQAAVRPGRLRSLTVIVLLFVATFLSSLPFVPPDQIQHFQQLVLHRILQIVATFNHAIA